MLLNDRELSSCVLRLLHHAQAHVTPPILLDLAAAQSSTSSRTAHRGTAGWPQAHLLHPPPLHTWSMLGLDFSLQGSSALI